MQRKRDVVMIAVLTATVAAGAVAMFASGSRAFGQQRCPAGAIRVDTDLPTAREQVRVRVVGADPDRGALATALRAHRFDVSEAPGEAGTGTTTLRHGPSSVGAAWLLRASLPGSELVFDPRRTDGAVDVVVVPGRTAVATVTETRQALAAQGVPTASPGTCPKT